MTTIALGPNNTKVDLPSSISLRAGVMLVPPYQHLDGNEYSGFGPDLLVRMKQLALEDNVTLEFDVSRAFDTPAQYTDALDMVANDCKKDCDKFDIVRQAFLCFFLDCY